MYQHILKRDNSRQIRAEHNVQVAGRSSVSHQIDVLWKFRQAGIEHTVIVVIVECKNYSSAITLEKVRNLFAVAHDIGNCHAVMVTKTGYQSGAAEFAKHYGTGLKLLRAPKESDWEGRIRTVHINVTTKSLSSDPKNPPICILSINGVDDAQKARIEKL